MSADAIITTTRGRFDDVMKEGQLVRQRVSVVVEKFSSGPDSPLDGSIHPALQQPRNLALIKTSGAPEVGINDGSENIGGQELLNTPIDIIICTPPDSGDVEEELFKAAMREYEATAKPKYRTGVDPDGEHCVEELWSTIEDAGKKYQIDDTKGAWGKVRLAFRKLGENNHAAEGWLGLLPHESHYLSVVCGGLKLVLHAAARMRKVADLVLEKFSEIPIILSGTRRVLSIFRDSQELQAQSRALYKSILSAIGHMLHYLQRKSAGKTIKAFFSQENFETGLVDRINDISKHRDSFNEHAEICHKEALKRLEETTRLSAETNNKNADGIKNEIRSLCLIVKAAEDERERVQRTIANAMAFMAMEQVELRREMAAMREVNLMAIQYFKQLMKANPVAMDVEWSKRNRLEALEDDPYQTRPPERRNSVLGIMPGKRKIKKSPNRIRQRLLSQLDYDPDVPGQDLSTNYKLGSNFPLQSQERSLFLIKSRQLRDWVDSAHSVALVVNGSAETVTPRSALSFVCARLVYVLDEIRTRIGSEGSASEIPGIIPLYFFCGQHVRRDQSWESPSGVLNSLLAQLLTQCKKLDLTKLTRSRVNDLDSADIREVLRFFKETLSLLPTTSTVFCVVDGLSFYLDDRGTADNGDYLAAELLKLAGRKTKSEQGPIVKLLLTAPKRLRAGEKELGYERVTVLNIPQTLPATGGFTAMKWTTGVGGQLDKLG